MTMMKKEILETASVLRQQADNHHITELREYYSHHIPSVLLTLARGTSDHAAEYLSYLLMRYRGMVCASLPLSLNSLYHAQWKNLNALALAISQSGGSQDLVDSVKGIQHAGIPVLSILNTVPSPVAEVSEKVFALNAGVEQALAATKSFVATISAGLRIFASWFDNAGDFITPLNALPEKIEQAQTLDWSKALDMLKDAQRLYVVGRGAGLAIAKEAALKCKETCLMQGEAFSGAEVQHGPMALMNPEQIVLIFAPKDESQKGLVELAKRFKDMGAKVLLATDDSVKGRDLSLLDAGHPMLQGLTTIQTFYTMIEQLSVVRGVDTDNPPHLKKVTVTR